MNPLWQQTEGSSLLGNKHIYIYNNEAPVDLPQHDIHMFGLLL